jgi:ABC-type multidrug transport system fused ATPase/permease subunit
MNQLRTVLRWYAGYWRRHRGGMILVLALTALAVGAATLYPLIFKFVLDRLVHEGDPLGSRRWVLALLGAGLFQQLIQWLLPVSRAWMNLEHAMDIRLELFRRLLRKTAPFFSRFRSGDLVTRLTDDIDNDDKLSWYACSGVMRPIEAILRLVFALGVMLALDWRLTLLSVAPLPLVVWLMTRTEHLQERYYSERQKRTSETVEVLESAFSGVRIVIAYAAEAAQGALFRGALARRIRSEKAVLTLRAVLEGLGSLLNQSGVIIVLFAGGVFLIRGEITLGDFYAFVAYLSSLTGPLWTISWFFVSTTVVASSVARMRGLEEPAERPLGEQEPAEGGALCFEGLRFDWNGAAGPEAHGEEGRQSPPLPQNGMAQPQGAPAAQRDARLPEAPAIRRSPPLINGVDLRIAPGETVALVGPVGCGKTTLLELGAGILEPLEGRVHLGGTPVTTLDEERRSSWIGWVPQESLLFSGRVDENIRLERPEIDEDRVAAALDAACLKDEFAVDRVIEQGGVGLSGGQRGRVSLARAIAPRPGFLLLDDAPSALDAETERRFWLRLRRELPDAGVLVATHREATARAADRVVWLEDGKLIHEGVHEQLLATHNGYRELFAREE